MGLCAAGIKISGPTEKLHEKQRDAVNFLPMTTPDKTWLVEPSNQIGNVVNLNLYRLAAGKKQFIARDTVIDIVSKADGSFNDDQFKELVKIEPAGNGVNITMTTYLGNTRVVHMEEGLIPSLVR